MAATNNMPPVLRELIDTDLPADELRRLARVDGVLRLAGPGARGEQTLELKLGFSELALIYKSLQAAKTLGALPPQDDLLDDTIELVDQALKNAI